MLKVVVEIFVISDKYLFVEFYNGCDRIVLEK